MKIDKRVERNTRSIEGIITLLEDVLRDPKKYVHHAELKEAITSQSKLAKFSDPTRNIIASSLNTMKRIAENRDGGYAAVDELRKTAIEALEIASKEDIPSKRITRSHLESKLREIERERDKLREDFLLLTYVLGRSLEDAKSYATEANDAAVAARCKNEQRTLLLMLGPLRSSSRPNLDNVISIKRGKD